MKNNNLTPTIGKISVRVFNKCVRFLSEIKLPTEKEPTYKEEDIFSVLAIANIFQWAIESVVGETELMKRFGLYTTKYPSADIVFTRLKKVKRENLPCHCKELVKKLVRKAKRLKLIGKKVALAIDFHKVPRHTKKRFESRKKKCDDLAYTTGIRWKNGARLAHVFATIQIINASKRSFVLGGRPLSQLDNRVNVVRELIKEAKEVLGDTEIRCIYMDGDFDSIEMINLFKELEINYVVRMGKDQKVKKLTFEKIFTLYHIEYDYIIGDENKEHAKTNLVIINREELQRLGYKIGEKGKEDRYYTYATSLKPRKGNELKFCLKLCFGYKYRWGIETGYREVEDFRGYTHSLSYTVRIWLFVVAILLYNLWLLVNAELRKLCSSIGSHYEPITKYQFKFMNILGYIFVTLKDDLG